MPEIEVYCECGKVLGTGERMSRGSFVIEVEPCSDCLAEAHEEGRKEGFKQAEQEAGL